MADQPQVDLEERTAQVINTVMFALLGGGFAILVLFTVAERIMAATSPVNFLHDSWQYALGAVLLAAWGARAIRDAVRRLRRRALNQP